MTTRINIKINKFQTKELSKLFFDLSKLTFGSLILKFFEQGPPKFTIGSIGTMLWGLILVIIFVIVGMLFGRNIKK